MQCSSMLSCRLETKRPIYIARSNRDLKPAAGYFLNAMIMMTRIGRIAEYVFRASVFNIMPFIINALSLDLDILPGFYRTLKLTYIEGNIIDSHALTFAMKTLTASNL
jgi:hypothetical protein